MFLSYGERRINVICILYVVERIPIQYLYSISLSVSGPIDSTFLSGKDLEVSQAQAEAAAKSDFYELAEVSTRTFGSRARY